MNASALAPWFWRSQPLCDRTGTQVFEQVQRSIMTLAFTPHPMATLLESPYPTPTDYPHLSRYSIAAWGPRLINGQPRLWTPALGDVLPCLRSRFHQGQESNWVTEIPNPELPFTGGWLGWLGYDLAWEIESLPTHNREALPYPLALWYEPDYFCVLDHHDQVLWIAASRLEDLDPLAQVLDPQAPMSSTCVYAPVPKESCAFDVTFHSAQTDYEMAVQKAKAYIRSGDIFQANLSLRFSAQTALDSWTLYRRLHHINPSPFASYWRTPWGDVVSCSPERLVQVRDRQVQTRPIAGTRPRGYTPEADEHFAQDLLRNTKERAEHIMLVDLERNDVGRICEWGSVQVDTLLCIERYSHVMHLVSNVIGVLHSDYNAIDVIRAVFPGGTITGCPKVRCMEIIEDLEPDRRSLFYGSCGYMDWRGSLDLNILIRTLLHVGNSPHRGSLDPHATVWGQVGAGIVADSDPELEWLESLQKAKAQLAALQDSLQ